MVHACSSLLKQEDREFEGILGFREGPYLKRKEMRKEGREGRGGEGRGKRGEGREEEGKGGEGKRKEEASHENMEREGGRYERTEREQEGKSKREELI